MKLYYNSVSPFVRKVSIVAIETGLASRIENVPTAVVPHVRNADLAAHNPLAKVPTLTRDDGSELYDSTVICEYLDAQGGGRFFPAAGEARWDTLRRHALAQGVLEAALLVRYETFARPEALRWQGWIDGQLAKVDAGLDIAERERGRGEGRFDIGDVALVCALGYLDYRFAARPWRTTRPQLAAWFERLHAERDSVRSTVPAE